MCGKWPVKRGNAVKSREFPSILPGIVPLLLIEPVRKTNLWIGSQAVFALDLRLQQDTLLIGDFPLCRLLLSNDSNYPWFILVPRRANISEVFELEADDQLQLWQETTALSQLLKGLFAADKLNVAALGNVVSQLHMHVIVRKRDDAAWPAPVWGKHPARPYTAAEFATIQQRLLGALPKGFIFAEQQS